MRKSSSHVKWLIPAARICISSGLTLNASAKTFLIASIQVHKPIAFMLVYREIA